MAECRDRTNTIELAARQSGPTPSSIGPFPNCRCSKRRKVQAIRSRPLVIDLPRFMTSSVPGKSASCAVIFRRKRVSSDALRLRCIVVRIVPITLATNAWWAVRLICSANSLVRPRASFYRTTENSADAAALALQLVDRGTRGDPGRKPEATSIYIFKMARHTTPARSSNGLASRSA